MPAQLRYPLDQNDYPAKVVFTVRKAGKTKFTSDLDEAKGTVKTPPSTDGDQIVLYLPTALQYTDAATYNNSVLGASGAIAEKGTMMGLEAGNFSAETMIGTGISAAFDMLKKGAATAGDIIRGEASPEIAKLVATQAIARQLGDDQGISAGILSGSRLSENPNFRTLFTDVPIRTFTFGFKMIPESVQEKDAIIEIIKTFRTELYPDLIGKIGDKANYTSSYGYSFPNTFRISTYYRDEANALGHKFLECYLTNMTTTYNAESQGFLEEGGRVDFSDYQMNLSFTEVRALNRNDVEKGGF